MHTPTGRSKKENRWEEQKNMLETAACVCSILQPLEVNQQIIMTQDFINIPSTCTLPVPQHIMQLCCLWASWYSQRQSLNGSINPTPHLYTGHTINSFILITGEAKIPQYTSWSVRLSGRHTKKEKGNCSWLWIKCSCGKHVTVQYWLTRKKEN